MKLPEQDRFKMLLRHKGRSILATFLMSLSSLGILTSLGLIAVGAIIHESVKPYRAILDSYDGAYLSFILGGLGIAGFIVYALLAFLLLAFTSTERSNHFAGIVVTLLVLAACTFVASIMCFAHIHTVGKSFKKGIHVGMNSYKNTTIQKTAIDEIQIRYKCCGLRGYADWFNISWVNESYVDKQKLQAHTKNGVYLADDVPYSCCDTAAFRPCIHDGVHTNSHHFNYDHLKNVTIYKPGCLDRLKRFFGHGLLFILGAIVLAIAAVDSIIAAGTRILYTSLMSARQRDDELGPGYGILWPGRIPVYESLTNLEK